MIQKRNKTLIWALDERLRIKKEAQKLFLPQLAVMSLYD